MLTHIISISLLTCILLARHVHTQFTDTGFANTTGPNGPTIDLGYIQLVGTHVTSASLPLNAWLGVRYGASTAGSQRFKAGTPIETVKRTNLTFDASTYGPICFQGYTYSSPKLVVAPELNQGTRLESEDCLLLDIYAPTTPTSSKLPVYLSIHGGGFIDGSSTQVTLNSIIAATKGQVIFVSIQYRLAGFGFLGGAEVEASGTLNAGLLDQRQALQWVQRHIGAFGGDPDKVTIQGGSAGGASVLYHFMWAGGRDRQPFRSGIAEFPSFDNIPNASTTAKQYLAVLQASSCSNITCLRSLSSEEYANAQQKALNDSAAYPPGLSYFGPLVDGKILGDLPSKELQAGHISQLPIILTRDGNEGLSFTPLKISTSEQFDARIQSLFLGGSNFFGRLNDLYPPTDTSAYGYNSSQQLRSEYVVGDKLIKCPTYYAASTLTNLMSLSPSSSTGAQVYKYIYALPTYTTAGHGSVVAVTRQVYAANDTSTYAQLSRIILAYYASFIINGDPNSGAVSTNDTLMAPWLQYGATSQVLLLNSSTPIPINDIDANPRCDFLWNHGVAARN